MTCWRRLCDWQHAGIWELMHFALLDWLPEATGSIGRERLRVRCDEQADIHEAFLSLGCALICGHSLRKIW
jgi:hypothetical protein